MGEKENAEILLLTNAILKDNQISLKAKGIYFNLIFFIEEQDLTIGMIKKMNQIDSDRSIKMGLTELEKGGYLIRKTLPDGEACWDFNSSMNIKNKKEVKVRTVNENIKDQTNKPTRKKVQPKKNTRTRKTAKKTGLNRALSNFLKEFF